jgi:hypothetical protein
MYVGSAGDLGLSFLWIGAVEFLPVTLSETGWNILSVCDHFVHTSSALSVRTPNTVGRVRREARLTLLDFSQMFSAFRTEVSPRRILHNCLGYRPCRSHIVQQPRQCSNSSISFLHAVHQYPEHRSEYSTQSDDIWRDSFHLSGHVNKQNTDTGAMNVQCEWYCLV